MYNYRKKIEKIQLLIILMLFIGFVPALLFLYWGINSSNIFFNKNNYKQGIFIIDSLYCGSGYGADDSQCYGYGKIKNTQIWVTVGLGLNPDKIDIYNSKYRHADLEKDQYEVFYRPNGKQTLLKKENESKFNAVFYLKRGILELIFPLIIYPLFIVYYKYLTKKLKTIKNEQT